MAQKHLPHELIDLILRRMRVKHLLKLRTICKAWKTLIDSHSFKLAHFQFQSAVNSTHLIWRSDEETHFLHFLSPHHDSYETSVTLPTEIDDPIFPPLFSSYVALPDYFKIFGVANGLVCLGCETRAVIWNPSTREFRNIDLPYHHWDSVLLEPSRITGELYMCGPDYAFGFDPKTNDYKFVATDYTTKGKVVVLRYSMRSDDWTTFAVDFPYFVHVEPGDGFLDGSFYWFAKYWCNVDDETQEGCGIVKFDFSLEKFDLIKFSGGLADRKRNKKCAVVTSRGCLELITTIVDGNEGRCCEIWGVGDDGMWFRKFRVGLSPHIGTPRGIRKDGQILCGEGVPALFNPVTGSCKILGDDSYDLWVLTFVESLFSVYP